MNSVSYFIAHSIVDIDNVSDVGRELRERFSKVGRIRVWKFKIEINNLKQGTNSINDYYAKLWYLWEEFYSHRPILSYTCPQRCVGASMCNVREFKYEDQVIQFLNGLNDHFSIIQIKSC